MGTNTVPGIIPEVGKWAAPTHRDALVAAHGLAPGANPAAECACGRRVLSDACVDVSLLPAAVRGALGLEGVDYICDGCRMVLHVHRYLSCETLCALLGAPAEVLAEARAQDREYVMGMRRRPRELRALHKACTVAADGSVTGGARMPHVSGRRRTHADSAAEIQKIGIPMAKDTSTPVASSFPKAP